MSIVKRFYRVVAYMHKTVPSKCNNSTRFGRVAVHFCKAMRRISQRVPWRAIMRHYHIDNLHHSYHGFTIELKTPKGNGV